MDKIKIYVTNGEGEFKDAQRLKNCLEYVANNFAELEPIIREHWVKKEMKQLKETKKAEDKER